MPTLTQGVIAATLPTGEIVHSIYAYIGTYIAIGTNKGVRIGIIDDQGDITYGPLIIESSSPVEGFTGKDRFIFAARSGDDAGLWRIDLGNPKEDGSFPYANDLAALGVDADVNSVTLYGASGRVVFGVEGDGSYIEQASVYAASGWFRTGYVRFNTVEPKQFKYVSARTTGDGGTVAISTVDRSETEVSLYSFDATSGNSGDVAMQRTQPDQYLGLKFTLTRDSGDSTITPVLNSWQIKSLPATKRPRELKVPVLLYEQMKDAKGAWVEPIDVNTVLQQLEAYEDNADTVNFTLLRHEPTLTESVTIEKVELIQTTPPANVKGDGGIVYLTLRTVQ
jgi:hypothetical protein